MRNEGNVNVWYDKEGDYLEVNFEKKKGFFKQTSNDAVMEKVDEDGNLIGFSIQEVSELQDDKPISVDLQKRIA